MYIYIYIYKYIYICLSVYLSLSISIYLYIYLYIHRRVMSISTSRTTANWKSISMRHIFCARILVVVQSRLSYLPPSRTCEHTKVKETERERRGERKRVCVCDKETRVVLQYCKSCCCCHAICPNNNTTATVYAIVTCILSHHCCPNTTTVATRHNVGPGGRIAMTSLLSRSDDPRGGGAGHNSHTGIFSIL